MMENVTTSVVNVAKTTLWQSNKCSLLSMRNLTKRYRSIENVERSYCFSMVDISSLQKQTTKLFSTIMPRRFLVENVTLNWQKTAAKTNANFMEMSKWHYFIIGIVYIFRVAVNKGCLPAKRNWCIILSLQMVLCIDSTSTGNKWEEIMHVNPVSTEAWDFSENEVCRHTYCFWLKFKLGVWTESFPKSVHNLTVRSYWTIIMGEHERSEGTMKLILICNSP